MKAPIVYALLAVATLAMAAAAVLTGLHDTVPAWFEAGFFACISAAAGVTIPTAGGNPLPVPPAPLPPDPHPLPQTPSPLG